MKNFPSEKSYDLLYKRKLHTYCLLNAKKAKNKRLLSTFLFILAESEILHLHFNIVRRKTKEGTQVRAEHKLLLREGDATIVSSNRDQDLYTQFKY